MSESAEKYCCPVCKTIPIYDSQGTLLSGESQICECCSKRICVLCGYTDDDRHTMFEGGFMPEYIYSTFISDDFICHNCIVNAEKDYIDSIPKIEIPLHVNDIWYEDENKDYFNQKLQK